MLTCLRGMARHSQYTHILGYCLRWPPLVQKSCRHSCCHAALDQASQLQKGPPADQLRRGGWSPLLQTNRNQHLTHQCAASCHSEWQQACRVAQSSLPVHHSERRTRSNSKCYSSTRI